MRAVLQFSSVIAWLLHELPPGRRISFTAVTWSEWLAGLTLVAAGQARLLAPTLHSRPFAVAAWQCTI